MGQRLLCLSVLASLFLLSSCGRSAPTQPLQAQTEPTARARDRVNERVVLLRSGADAHALARRHGLTVLRTLRLGGNVWVLLQPPAGHPATLARTLWGDGEVALVMGNEPTWAPEADREPLSFDDTDGNRTPAQYASQVALVTLHAEAAHAIATGSGVRVAVLDTGIEPTHPGFAGTSIEVGADYTLDPPTASCAETRNGVDEDGDGLTDEAFGHGTHVAGIVHVAAPAATLIAVKVLSDDGRGTSFELAEAIQYAVSVKQADIVNLSLGLTADDPLVADAIAWATGQGVAVVASAGNHASHQCQFPAGYVGAISVTAVDSLDVKAGFANWDETVDLSAPGENIVSLFPPGTSLGSYASGSGCSVAVPWVSGAIALVKSHVPAQPAAQAAATVVGHATSLAALNPSYSSGMGTGRVDLLAPLQVP